MRLLSAIYEVKCIYYRFNLIKCSRTSAHSVKVVTVFNASNHCIWLLRGINFGKHLPLAYGDGGIGGTGFAIYRRQLIGVY